MQHFKKSKYTLSVPLASAGEGLSGAYNTVSRGMILATEEALLRIINTNSLPGDEPLTELLWEHGLLVPTHTDEDAVFEIWRQQHVHDCSTMRSKVVVTRHCNNRCRYCIVAPEATAMSHETARAMDRYYFKYTENARPEKIRDEFTGGEPLLNAAIIRESAERRYHYCLGKGIDYGFTFITNGTLLSPELIRPMKEIGLEGIRVSLAGPAEVHDRLRPSSDGGKTYDLIVQNLLKVSGLAPITLECQYDEGGEDYRRIPEMLEQLKKHGIIIENINFTPILPRRNGTNDGPVTDGPEILLHLMREAQANGYPQLQEPPMNCCSAEFLSRVTFDTDGSLIPCPVLQSGEMVYGNVFTGIDFIAHAQILHRRLPERCLHDCELLPLCLGGCRLQALICGAGFNGVNCRYECLRLILEEYIRASAAQALASASAVEPRANAA